MRLSDSLDQAAAAVELKATMLEGAHKKDLLLCADGFKGAAQDARDLERDLVGAGSLPKKSIFRFRGHHLRRRFRSGRARKDAP